MGTTSSLTFPTSAPQALSTPFGGANPGVEGSLFVRSFSTYLPILFPALKSGKRRHS
jgi:hypothetical protein